MQSARIGRRFLQRNLQTAVERKLAEPSKSSLKFKLPHTAGALASTLGAFRERNINMTRLETRPSTRDQRSYEFLVDFEGQPSDPAVRDLMLDLSRHCSEVQVLKPKKVPWFPRHLAELDLIANQILDAGAELQADHPGFNDKVYRERRAQLAQLALDYKYGKPISRIEYSENETKTWGAVLDKLLPLVEKHGCKEHVDLLPLLEKECGYTRDNIPQIQDISSFLKSRTGFTIRPVAGLLSARNFLYGLAFRVFFSTQYIRHHSMPLYTPEPDICHELLGHAPLFADPAFADFSEEIGLAAIGATDEQITQLARCYWFSVEFGVIQPPGGERKAYGAGLLSSFGELEYSMSAKPEIRPWNPFQACNQDYPITTYQPIYYAATSFEDAKHKMSEFSQGFARPFNVRFNPKTESLEVDANIEVMEAPPAVKN